MPRAGEYRERAAVYSVSRPGDTQGGGAIAPTLVGTEWVAVEPVSGREVLAAGQLTATLTHRVRLRYSRRYAALTPKWQLVWRSRTLVIESVHNVAARDRELVMLCSERTS